MVIRHTRIHWALIAVATLGLFSCGYSEDRPSQDFDYYNSEWLFPCELRGEQLSSLLEKNIQEDLDCLKRRLKIFNLYVRRDEGQEIIALPTLEAFTKEYFPDQVEALNPQIHLMFELNSLLFEGPQEYITSSNLDLFFDIMIVLNREVVHIRQIFDQHSRQKSIATLESNQQLSEEFRLAHQRIKDGVLPLLSKARQQTVKAPDGTSFETLNREPPGLNLRAFFNRIQALFPVYFSSATERQLGSFLGIKKLFLGGDREQITAEELSAFIDKMPSIATAVFESFLATRSPVLGQSLSPYTVYLSTLRKIVPQFHPQSGQEIIFEQEDLLRLLEAMFEESPRLEFYKALLLSTKSYLVDGLAPKNPYTTTKNIRSLSKIGEIALQFLHFWHQVGLLNIPVEEDRAAKRLALVTHAKQLASGLKNTPVDEIDLFTPHMQFKHYAEFLAQDLGEGQTQKGVEAASPWPSLISFAKQFLLGGSAEYTTFYQLQQLWDKLPALAEMAFDLYTIDPRQWRQMEFHQRMFHTTQKLKRLMHTEQHPLRPLFSADDLASWMALWQPEIDWDSTLASLGKVKKHWPGGGPGHYTPADLSTILDSAQDLWGHLWFVGSAYQLQQNTPPAGLAGIRPLAGHPVLKNNSWPAQDLAKWERQYDQHLDNLRRYGRQRPDANATTNTATNDQQTGQRAELIEMATVGHLVDKFAEVFGHRHPVSSPSTVSGDGPGPAAAPAQEYAWNINELNSMLQAFQDLFSRYGIGPRALPELATSNLLFADLFQFHSNGNFQMDTAEARELAALTLTSVKMGHSFTDRLREHCSEFTPQEASPNPRGPNGAEAAFPAPCIRSHFFAALLEDMQFEDSLEGLHHYIERTPLEGQQLFLQSLENFLFKEELAHFTPTQIVLMLQMVRGIEATFARYDKDNNKLLGIQELNESFQTHKNIVISVANLTEDEENVQYAETIYLYALKNGTFPGEKTVWWCHRIRRLCGLNGLSISRHHIAAVLGNLMSGEGGLQDKILHGSTELARPKLKATESQEPESESELESAPETAEAQEEGDDQDSRPGRAM